MPSADYNVASIMDTEYKSSSENDELIEEDNDQLDYEDLEILESDKEIYHDNIKDNVHENLSDDGFTCQLCGVTVMGSILDLEIHFQKHDAEKTEPINQTSNSSKNSDCNSEIDNAEYTFENIIEDETHLTSEKLTDKGKNKIKLFNFIT